MKSTSGPILIIHNIRSAQNVGALFRTADACGIEMIYLSSITPAPSDMFGRPNAHIAKTALGAETTIPWKQYRRISDVFRTLERAGYVTIAIEQGTETIPSTHYVTVAKEQRASREKIAFIVGNEVEGVEPSVLSRCTVIAEIPMKGTKESLNVSVAAGIAMFRILEI